MPLYSRSVPGFTLIELLAVVAIVGILAGIVIPVVGKVRASARSSQDLSNVRQLALAQLAHAAENNGRFAAGYDMGTPANHYGTLWQSRLVPYVARATTGFGPNDSIHDIRSQAGNIFVSPDIDPASAESLQHLGGALSGTTYRLNINLNAWSWWHGGPQWSFRMNAPPSPSRVLLLGNAPYADTDYSMPAWESWGTWADVAYPHADGTKSNWAFADGHVEAVSRERMEDGSAAGRRLWRWW